jgi:hypothetical protein
MILLGTGYVGSGRQGFLILLETACEKAVDTVGSGNSNVANALLYNDAEDRSVLNANL